MRLTLLVLMTTGVGYFAGVRGRWSWLSMLELVLGTALIAASAAALNQWMERDQDAMMRRTQDRPLPSGRLSARTALVFGLVAAPAGLIWLGLRVNGLTAGLGALTWLTYLLAYTPLKRVTAWNTVVGAIPGALPPLMGWTAATGEISAGGLALFGILFAWQLPHFLAIAWLYQDDYAKAGFRMLPLADASGLQTALVAFIFAALLLGMSFIPCALSLAGGFYLAGAAFLGAVFVGAAWRFMGRRDFANARRLFLMSIMYLPVLLALLILDRT